MITHLGSVSLEALFKPQDLERQKDFAKDLNKLLEYHGSKARVRRRACRQLFGGPNTHALDFVINKEV